MWQGSKLRRLIELENKLEKPGTQRTELETPNHQDTLNIPGDIFLLSVHLPEANTLNPLTVSSGYYLIFLKNMPKLPFFEFSNVDIVHSFPR